VKPVPITILSLYGLGRLPFSASLASLVAVLLYAVVHVAFKPAPAVAISIDAIETIAIALVAIGPLRRFEVMSATDPPGFVFDEFVGMGACLMLTQTSAVAPITVLFVAFRVLDIVKPEPFGWVDRNIGGRYGFIIDDVVIGVALAACYWIYAALRLPL